MLVNNLFDDWSKKYKKSIDCDNPKGFSQKAHCAGRKARQAGRKTKSRSLNENRPTLMDGFRRLLPIAVKHLDLPGLPKIHLNKKQSGTHQASFGGYDSGTDEITLTINNRHPVDILRTLAHELVHYKQKLDGKLENDSWKTGSDAENEANAEAGVIMRLFNKQNPEFMGVPPILERRAVEPDPAGYQHDVLTFPQRALVVDTPGDLDWYKIGQHYPNLGTEDPHEYGQSDSDMVIVPSSEKELEKLKHDLDRLGMNWKEIGGSYEHPEIHDEPKIQETIRKIGDRKWRLYSKDGKKNLGTFSSLEAAKKHEREVQFFKHMSEMSHREAEKLLKKHHYHLERTHGGHDIYKDEEGHTFALPHKHHAKDISKGVEHQLKKEVTHENFADGKKPGRKGLAKRMGVDCSKSETELRKIAKSSTGEKQRMAHWCANMKKD